MGQIVKKLSNAELSKLQALESELGCCVVAMDQQSTPAALSASQLKELQAMEKEINAVLVAYACNAGQ